MSQARDDRSEDLTQWGEPSLVEFEFQFGPAGRAGLARLGLPRPDERHPGEWVCAFQISGPKDSRIRVARGEDGLHALMIASSAVRSSLDRLGTFRPDGIAHETVFPQFLPTCYGLDFHRELCGVLDAAIKKKDRQLLRRWLARKKRVAASARE